MTKKTGQTPRERRRIPLDVRIAVLTEAGYRCAVPTCRGILALDMHHLWEVSAGGGDTPENLIALCPTDHALYHRGTIHQDSIYAYKAMLVSMGRAFDLEAIDLLLFLTVSPPLWVSGDGIINFARLIAAGFVEGRILIAPAHNAGPLYQVLITERGGHLIDAWKRGDRTALQEALVPGPDQRK